MRLILINNMSNKISIIFYKITIGLSRKIYFSIREIYKYLIINHFVSLHRLSSKPYISGDTFRSFADHIFDETKKFKPEKVKNNDVVFVKTDYLIDYLKNIHKKINSRYILLSHNGDKNFDSEILNFLDHKIIHAFIQNLDLESYNKKIDVLPIGLENRRFMNSGILRNFRDKKVLNNASLKNNRILSSFSPHTNMEKRHELSEMSKNIKFVDVKILGNHVNYLRELAKYKFNFCPEGNGIDTHRFWESLILKTMPIALKSNINLEYKKLGLPILLLDTWSDILTYTEDDLEAIYKKEFNSDDFQNILMFAYWKNKINNKKI